MPSSDTSSDLQRRVNDLREFGVVPSVAAMLQSDGPGIVASICGRVVGDVAAFTTSANPDLFPQLETHVSELIGDICHQLSGQAGGEFGFVCKHAIRRAEQKFPLDAELSAYRLVHRAVVPWLQDASTKCANESAQLRRVMAAAANFANEYMSTISSLLTSEYVLQTRLAAEAEGDRRTELLNMLLSGYDESDSRAAQLLRRAGYLEQRQSFCIAVSRSVAPQEMENAARAERMANAVSQALSNLPIRVLIGVRDSLVTIVMSGSRRLSGWTAPQSLLADRVYPHLRTVGPAALIGVSSDAPSTSHIPAALEEAKIALDFATVAERVMPYSRIPFRSMLVNVAAPRLQSALPQWVSAFRQADEKSRGALSETLRAYADADMNALKTAKNLSLHPNTIYARMQKINDTTQINPLTYNALTELLLALDCIAAE